MCVCECACVRARAPAHVYRCFICVCVFFGGGLNLIPIEVGLSVMSPSSASCAVGSQRVLELLDTPER